MGIKKAKTKKIKNVEEEEVDYAAVADEFANHTDEESGSDDENDNNDDENDVVASDDDSQSHDDSENSNGSEDDTGDSEEEEGDNDDEDPEEDAEEEETAVKVVSHSSGTEPCTFDLHNLLVINSYQMDTSKMYMKKSGKFNDEEDITIPPETLAVAVNEKYLLEKAAAGCTQLVAALWQLPIESSDIGPMVSLPLHDGSKIPRELPPPPPKKETKWEKFAKLRGISLNKEKRSQKVFDEATGEWMYRHGYRKANDDTKEWPIMEVKANDDPYADPWEKQREEKRSRKDKNLESRMRNEERAGKLAKGTTNKVLKNREKTRIAGKAGGDLDRYNVPPSGVPVDLKPTKGNDDIKSMKRGKASIASALLATQRSTASLGNFDKMLEGEPERKKNQIGVKKRKFEGNTDKTVVSTEAERAMKVFKHVVEGGGAQKEKARLKGRLAKGETAYDYEFNDGLGPSTFHKKKGRAAAGKMKKMTKKRIK